MQVVGCVQQNALSILSVLCIFSISSELAPQHLENKKAECFLSVFPEANPPRASPAHQSFMVRVTTGGLANPLDRPHITSALA